MILSQNIKDLIQAHAQESYPNECCGLLVKTRDSIVVIRAKNESSRPKEHFELSVKDYLRADSLGEILAMYHSQENDDFSLLDKQICKIHNIQSIVYCWKSNIFKSLHPKEVDSPYLDRTFEIGKNDCYTLAQNYYENELGIKLKDYPREEGWYKANPRLILDNYLNEGFQEVSFEEIQLNDAILFNIRGIEGCDHIGIYVGGGHFLHQPRTSLSKIESLERYLGKITKVLRYVNK